MTNSRFANRSELLGILALAVILVVILPLCLDVFRLNLVAKYLTYAFVALRSITLPKDLIHRRRVDHDFFPRVTQIVLTAELVHVLRN